MSTLLDVWSDPETTGIFTALNNYSVPWASDNIYESLNLIYYYNHSGQKNIGPLVSAVLGDDSSLTDDDISKIAAAVYRVYNKDWRYVWDAVFADYDPIENYNAIEAETIGTTGTRTGSGSESQTGTDTHAKSGDDTHAQTGTDTHAKTGDDTHTQTGTDTNTESGTQTDQNATEDGTSVTQNQTYGFNSSAAVDADKSTTTINQTVNDTVTFGKVDTREYNLENKDTYGSSDTETLNLTNTDTYNSKDTETLNLSRTTSDNESTSGSTTRNLTRHGNIGVTTSQQMIESELELRKKHYFDIIFRDIDKLLTLSVY